MTLAAIKRVAETVGYNICMFQKVGAEIAVRCIGTIVLPCVLFQHHAGLLCQRLLLE